MTASRYDELETRLRQAARALGRAGLVHAYGHCSVRIDETSFLVCAPIPMGLISNEPGTIVSVDGPLPDCVLGEVRIHKAVYRRREDVGAICRIMPPALMALSSQGVTPAARHGIGAYFAPSPPLWDHPELLRTDESAAALAERLGDAPAIVMRGNGAVVVADRLEKAVTLSWFLEDAARIERDVRAMGFPNGGKRLTDAEAARRQIFSGGVVERMWQFLTAEPAQ